MNDIDKAMQSGLNELRKVVSLNEKEESLFRLGFSSGRVFEAKRVDKGLDKLLTENRGVL